MNALLAITMRHMPSSALLVAMLASHTSMAMFPTPRETTGQSVISGEVYSPLRGAQQLAQGYSVEIETRVRPRLPSAGAENPIDDLRHFPLPPDQDTANVVALYQSMEIRFDAKMKALHQSLDLLPTQEAAWNDFFIARRALLPKIDDLQNRQNRKLVNEKPSNDVPSEARKRIEQMRQRLDLMQTAVDAYERLYKLVGPAQQKILVEMHQPSFVKLPNHPERLELKPTPPPPRELESTQVRNIR